jgi:polar amino acid transport system substrate-binding protein
MPLSRTLTGCVATLFLIGYAGLLRAETLIIAGDEWCPVNCAADSARPGIFVELAREVFAEVGIDVEYQTMNWARTLQLVRRGEVNAAVGAGIEDAPDFVFHDAPLALSRNCFYTLPGSTWHWTGIASLESQRLGVINDYSYGDELNAYINTHRNNRARIQLASGDRALALSVGKLMRNRLDVVLENQWVIQSLLSKQGDTGKLRDAGCRSPDVPIYLGFSPALKNSQRYVKIFNQGLKRYRDNGRLQGLFEAYGVTEH